MVIDVLEEKKIFKKTSVALMRSVRQRTKDEKNCKTNFVYIENFKDSFIQIQIVITFFCLRPRWSKSNSRKKKLSSFPLRKHPPKQFSSCSCSLAWQLIKFQKASSIPPSKPNQISSSRRGSNPCKRLYSDVKSVKERAKKSSILWFFTSSGLKVYAWNRNRSIFRVNFRPCRHTIELPLFDLNLVPVRIYFKMEFSPLTPRHLERKSSPSTPQVHSFIYFPLQRCTRLSFFFPSGCVGECRAFESRWRPTFELALNPVRRPTFLQDVQIDELN